MKISKIRFWITTTLLKKKGVQLAWWIILYTIYIYISLLPNRRTYGETNWGMVCTWIVWTTESRSASLGQFGQWMWRRRGQLGREKYYYHEAVAIIRGTGHDTNYFGQRRCTYAIIIIKNKSFGHKTLADCRLTVFIVVATHIASIIILSSVFVWACV